MVDPHYKSDLTQVLLVEDDDDDFVLTREMLEDSPHLKFRLDRVSDYDAGIAAIGEDRHDIYLVDYRLGKKDGLDLIRNAVRLGCRKPIILLTGLDSQDVDLRAMEAGATDYLIKGQMSSLLLERAIRFALSKQQLLEAERASKQILEQTNQRLSELYRTAHNFVDNVSHEFRTPLAVIKEYASIMRDGIGGEVSDEHNAFLVIVLDRVEDLRRLVDGMLDVSRIEAGLLGVCRRENRFNDICDHIRPILDRKAMSAGCTLSVVIADDLPAVYCDAEKIGRVIINLAVNAIKFGGDDGLVEIAAHYDAASSNVIATVTDNGPGIAAEDLEPIFERFQRTGDTGKAASKGFGLGLNIAKELVDVGLGEISVESTLGSGSRFSFTIPANQPQSILEKYLSRLMSSSPDDALGFVSLTMIGLSKGTSDEIGVQVEEKLQCQLRHSDLLLDLGRANWALFSASVAAAPNSSLVDLETGHGLGRSCAVKPVGCWEVPAGATSLREAFDAVLRSVDDGVRVDRPVDLDVCPENWLAVPGICDPDPLRSSRTV